MMFQWDKTLKTLDIPAEQLLQLFRSMRDVQLALPATPAQEVSAYLCQYQTGANVSTVVVFHLHKSAQLAIYADSPREVPDDRADRAIDQALNFVESMGFLMNDLDIQLHNASDRKLLWESLPLQKGCSPAGMLGQAKPSQSPASGKATAPPAQKRPPIRSEDPFGMLADLETPSPAGGRAPATPAPSAAVDDLLAAVEALRAGRPGVRPRKKVPTVEELRRRRQELYANVGRILASL